MKITYFERLKMLPLTEKENKSYYEQKNCYICKNKLIVILEYTGKFKIMIILVQNVVVLHISYAISDIKTRT